MAMADTDDPLAQALYTDMKTWLPGDILTKVDRASMANSLEVRAPFLDHHFVEWAATLPSELKLHRGTSKYILKRALDPLLPTRDPLPAKARVLDATMPAGFGGRFERDFAARLKVPILHDTGYFEPKELERLVDDHERGRQDHSAVLWLLLVFAGFLNASATEARPLFASKLV